MRPLLMIEIMRAILIELFGHEEFRAAYRSQTGDDPMAIRAKLRSYQIDDFDMVQVFGSVPKNRACRRAAVQALVCGGEEKANAKRMLDDCYLAANVVKRRLIH